MYPVIQEKLKQECTSDEDSTSSSDSEATVMITPPESDGDVAAKPHTSPNPTPKGQFNTVTFGVKKDKRRNPRKESKIIHANHATSISV